MLSYEESLKILKETNALIGGHFILSSGLHSPRYVQCAQLLSKPHKAFKICNSLAEKIKSSFESTCGRNGLDVFDVGYITCSTPEESLQVNLTPDESTSRVMLCSTVNSKSESESVASVSKGHSQA